MVRPLSLYHEREEGHYKGGRAKRKKEEGRDTKQAMKSP